MDSKKRSVEAMIKLLRPQQWVKNLFVYLPLFFSGNLLVVSKLYDATVAFAMFTLVASSIYCLNDVLDANADRKHPVKRNRPVASGRVSKGAAIALMILLAAGAAALGLLLPPESRAGSWMIVGVYFALNLAYCLGLKHVSILDVTIVSVGFVLRVALGGSASDIMVSHWIIIMTFLLALFLSLAKRRDDVVIYEATGKKMRRNIKHYNTTFINQAITIVGTITIVAYIIYSMSPSVIERIGSDDVYITSIYVLLGILRYLQLTIVDVKSGSPTKVLLSDPFVGLCVIGWVVTFAIIIY